MKPRLWLTLRFVCGREGPAFGDVSFVLVLVIRTLFLSVLRDPKGC